MSESTVNATVVISKVGLDQFQRVTIKNVGAVELSNGHLALKGGGKILAIFAPEQWQSYYLNDSLGQYGGVTE